MNTLQLNAFGAFTRVIEVTTDLFGECVTKASHDPEYPDEKWIVFVVEIDSDQDAVALESVWIERVRPWIPAWNSFRLSIQRKP